jgi:hypothetical protein
MLDFFLVLGQVPGTRFFLTFTEVFSAYTIVVSAYILHREYYVRMAFYALMRLNYVMYSSRVHPGPVRKRAILPDHIDLTPLIKNDFEHFWKSLQNFARRVQLVVERISQLGSSLRRPADGAF